ncbi:phosphopantetheine-binding protein [Streptomyces sp. NPDC060022]|uniref:phosphopantetheine-binding protein n=1 Tax=Streptomyces sp. NPDC060022 TaxID=3347039 RepID=UPI00369AF589
MHLRWAVVDLRELRRRAGFLDEEESRRAARLAPVRRAQFITGRWLLRTSLAPLMAVTARGVPLRTRCPRCGSAEHGRPEVRSRGLPWQVSLTHVGRHVGVLVSRTVLPVGVDVEPVGRRRAVVLLEPKIFGSTLPRQKPHDAGLSALRAWCLGEAYVKASGTELASAFRRIRPQPLPGGRLAVPRAPVGGWYLREIPAPAGHVASAALPAGRYGGPAARTEAEEGRWTMAAPENPPGTQVFEEEIRTRLEERVGHEVARGIGVDERFRDLGVDSLDLVHVLARLERDLEVPQIAAGDLWEVADTIGTLARHLARVGAKYPEEPR